MMERVAPLLWPLLGLTCVLLQLHAAQGRWLGSVQQELPPCGPSGVPGFDCYDPPNHPLPPCDFEHQRIGFDCSGWPPAGHSAAASTATFKSKSEAHQQHGIGGHHAQQELPPCGPGGVPGFDCYDPPNHPLPPCDFEHQRIGFDCSGWPPASHVDAASPAAFKSKSEAHQQHGIGGHHAQQELPPCGPGGVPGFDCYDPPNHPLPPCDFEHQRIGFDCSGWPPASQVDAASPAAFKSKSEAHQQHGIGGHHAQQELPPCGPGGVPGFDCYDPPNHPLPPCDFEHQRIGFDCSGWPPASQVDAASPAAFKSKSEAHQQHGIGGHHAQQELPPCGPGGVPGFDCYDPPNHPLPPCDFEHQRIGFDCSGWPPASHVDAASPAAFKSKSKANHVNQELLPCGPGGVPDYDCYDPPSHSLPPCDFNHQRIGFDCSGWPQASPVGATPSPVAFKSMGHQQHGIPHVQQELPLCRPGYIPGLECWDSLPLPPCNFRQNRVGFDCSGWPPAHSDSLFVNDYHG